MSIQRYAVNPHLMSGLTRQVHLPNSSGDWVQYEDHVEAVEAAKRHTYERLTRHDMHSGLACLTNYQAGQADERARIYQAVEALIDDGKEYQAVMLRNVLSIIDGEEDA